MTIMYFVGQGKVYIGSRSDVGSPSGFTELGNCPSLVLMVGTSAIRDAVGGAEDLPKAFTKGEIPSFTMTVEDLSSTNLSTFLYGKSTAVAGTSLTETTLCLKGKTVPLRHIGLTAWSHLKNSAGSVTYTEGVDYIVNRSSGSIYYPTTSGITEGQSVNATYTYGSYKNVAAFVTAPSYHWLRFEGLNNAENDDPVVVDIFKSKLKPTEQLTLIGDEVASLVINGRVFYDEFMADNEMTGGYFRVRML